jgi:RecA/RadA recombinase
MTTIKSFMLGRGGDGGLKKAIIIEVYGGTELLKNTAIVQKY